MISRQLSQLAEQIDEFDHATMQTGRNTILAKDGAVKVRQWIRIEYEMPSTEKEEMRLIEELSRYED